MGSESWPKLGVVMGVARPAQSGKQGRKAGAVETAKEVPDAQLRLPAADLHQLDLLTGFLKKKKHWEALRWMLALENPMLDMVRDAMRKADQIRKED